MLSHSLDLPHVLVISFMGSDSDILRRALHRYILCHTRRLRCYTCLSPQKGWVSEDLVLALLCCQPYGKSSLSFDTGVCGGPGSSPEGSCFVKSSPGSGECHLVLGSLWKHSRIAHSKEDLEGFRSSKLGNTQPKGPASHCVDGNPLGPDINMFPAFCCRPVVRHEVARIAQFIAFSACLGLLNFDSEFEAIEQRREQKTFRWVL